MTCDYEGPDTVLCAAQGDFHNGFILKCGIILQFDVFSKIACEFSFSSSSDLTCSKITDS